MSQLPVIIAPARPVTSDAGGRTAPLVSDAVAGGSRLGVGRVARHLVEAVALVLAMGVAVIIVALLRPAPHGDLLEGIGMRGLTVAQVLTRNVLVLALLLGAVGYDLLAPPSRIRSLWFKAGMTVVVIAYVWALSSGVVALAHHYCSLTAGLSFLRHVPTELLGLLLPLPLWRTCRGLDHAGRRRAVAVVFGLGVVLLVASAVIETHVSAELLDRSLFPEFHGGTWHPPAHCS